MRPSVRAEKYIRDASGWRKDVTDGNDNGTDGQTDRVRRNMWPPPREEGRIITNKLHEVFGTLCGRFFLVENFHRKFANLVAAPTDNYETFSDL